MSKPIYKTFLGKFTEAWYRLSEEEQAKVMDGIEASLEKLGITGRYYDASWSSEQWSFFGIEEYPDIEAVQKHTENLNALEWFRYIDSESVLGTQMEE